MTSDALWRRARSIIPTSDILSAEPGSAASLIGLSAARSGPDGTPLKHLADWVGDYLMQPHPDLGRLGHVCPFTARAARLDTIRLGVSPLHGDEPAAILQTMRMALRAFDAIPSQRETRHYRTVLVGFPHCAGLDDIQVLKQTQRAMRHHSILRAKMIGLFEPNSADAGLLNPDFRPLRCPVPTLAIRLLVANDVPFVLRNPLLGPVFMMKFPATGVKRLVPALYQRLTVSRYRPIRRSD